MFTRRDGLQLALAAANQDTPLEKGVREHAFYLKYQNKRANYLAGWNTVNWDRAAANFAKAPA